MKNKELMAVVERDVRAYLKILRAIDPGSTDEQYEKLRERLCPTIYKMRGGR